MISLKKHLKVLFCLLIVIIFTTNISVYAHSGGTDSSGGHYDSESGSYHYHHGYSAHQHHGGKCPYGAERKYENSVDRYFAQEKYEKKISFVDVISAIFVSLYYAVPYSFLCAYFSFLILDHFFEKYGCSLFFIALIVFFILIFIFNMFFHLK